LLSVSSPISARSVARGSRRSYHVNRRFKEHRLHGEWFAATSIIRRLAENLARDATARSRTVAWLRLGRKQPAPAVDLEIHRNRTDPFPSGSQCLWWWGDTKAVEEFCKWADDTASALWEYRESLPELPPAKGYYQTLATLCAVGLEAALGEPPLVVKRLLLKTDAHPRLPFALARAAPPVAFHVLDVADDGVTFALEVLDHLLIHAPGEDVRCGAGQAFLPEAPLPRQAGKPDLQNRTPPPGECIGNVPRLVVDVLGRTIGWEGQTYPVSQEQALIMDLLLKNLGKAPLTEKAMKASCPQLADVHFNRTMRTNLQKPLRDLVKSKRGQGWWLELD
jgi:hypothetical protein